MRSRVNATHQAKSQGWGALPGWPGCGSLPAADLVPALAYQRGVGTQALGILAAAVQAEGAGGQQGSTGISHPGLASRELSLARHPGAKPFASSALGPPHSPPGMAHTRAQPHLPISASSKLASFRLAPVKVVPAGQGSGARAGAGAGWHRVAQGDTHVMKPIAQLGMHRRWSGCRHDFPPSPPLSLTTPSQTTHPPTRDHCVDQLGPFQVHAIKRHTVNHRIGQVGACGSSRQRG